MPGAPVILALLGAVVTLWAASVLVRALAGRIPFLRLRAPAKSAGGAASGRSPRPVELVVGGLLLPVGLALFPVADYVRAWSTGRGSVLTETSPWSIGALFTLAVAGACLVVGLRFDAARGRRRCPKCWYNLAGLTVARCPECGRELASERALHRTRPNRRLAACAVPIAVLAFAVFKWPVYRVHGWTAFIPTTALIAGFTWLPESLILGNQSGAAKKWAYCLWDRRDDAAMWEWQHRWLESRCGRIAARSASLRELWRATYLSHGAEDAIGIDGLTTILKSLRSANLQERVVAAALAHDALRRASEDEAFEAQVRGLAAAQVPLLASALGDPVGEVSSCAAMYLACAGEHADPVLGRLLEQIRAGAPARASGSARVRWSTIIFFETLGALASESDLAAAALEHEIAEGAVPDRRYLIRSCRFQINKRPEFFDFAVGLLRHPDDETAACAARLLAYHSERIDVRELLVGQLLARATWRGDFILACISVEVRDPCVIPVLIESLRDVDAGTSEHAAMLLGELGAAGAPALPSLRRVAHDPMASESLRDLARQAIEQITDTPEPAGLDL